jgi:hypothetical protein
LRRDHPIAQAEGLALVAADGLPADAEELGVGLGGLHPQPQGAGRVADRAEAVGDREAGLPAIRRSSPSWISLSVRVSTFEVASSRMSMGLATIARAIVSCSARRC